MATAKIDVNYIAITEDRLREIIREEVARLVEPGAQRPSYVPEVLPWWLNQPYVNSLIASNESSAVDG